MAAQVEFLVGRVTTDMVETVLKEVLEELATPGSPIHSELGRAGLDLSPLSFDEVEVDERSNDFGATIAITIVVTIIEQVVVTLWEDVVRRGSSAATASTPASGWSSAVSEGDISVAAPPLWPDDGDPSQVALAARIVLFDASQLFPTRRPSPEQDQLANFIVWSTAVDRVGGRGFHEVLAGAQQRIRQDVLSHPNVRSALPQAMGAVREAQPVDVIATMFDALKALTAEAYRMPTLASLPLERVVVDVGERIDHVTGRVPRSRSNVMLTFDLDFDLFSFARLPWVLAHELVCHAAAGHTGAYGSADDTTTRQYFDEGFMNRTSTDLLLTWRERQEMDGLVPAGHLSAGEGQGHHSRPEALEAGKAAWTACRAAVGRHLRGLSPSGSATAPDRMVDATLRLNALRHDIREKDRFVAYAKESHPQALAAFVRRAMGEGPKGAFP